MSTEQPEGLSWTALPNWLTGKATPYEGWVLWVLQSHWPEMRPSLQGLTDQTGIGKSTLCRVLLDMERKGWITRTRSVGEDGDNGPTHYQLNIWSIDPGERTGAHAA